MGRLFDGKRNHRGNDGGGVMSEQEDIDSDYPDSEHGTMISEQFMGDEMYHSSHSGRNGSPFAKTNNGEDSDSDSDPGRDSGTESQEENNNNRVNARKGKDGDTDCSPTSSSEIVGDSSGGGGGGDSANKVKRFSDSLKGARKISRKASFFNKLFGGKNKKNKMDNPVLAESDIEHSESQSEAESNTNKQLNPNGDAESSMKANSLLEAAPSSSSVNGGNSQKQSTQAQEDRRKKFGSSMRRVTEEEEASDIERSFVENEKAPLTPPGQVKKRVQSIHDNIERNVRKSNSFHSGSSLKKKKSSVHSRSSRKKNRSVDRSNGAGVHRISPDPPVKSEEKTKKTRQKNKPKSQKNLKAHPAASSARNHGNPVITRIDYTGQIVPSSFNGNVSNTSSINYLPNQSNSDLTGKVSNETTSKLTNEVHRLKKLVELMMTRMELYEKQSECLVETSLEHNRQWKKATIELHDLEKRDHKNPTDEKLADIKNLLIERSVQEKWISQMEQIQRGYQDRLEATDKQLKVLRYAHVKTSKQIFSMRKSNNGSMESTPDTSASTRNKDMNELKTPVARNIPLARWTDETSGTTAALPTLPIDSKDANDNAKNSKNASKANGKSDPEGKKQLSQSQLLAEMIVSWHSTNSDMSPLSERGKSGSKKKKDKKKKKKRKEEVGAIL